jgi:hypothetical protein
MNRVAVCLKRPIIINLKIKKMLNGQTVYSRLEKGLPISRRTKGRPLMYMTYTKELKK